ncbi:MAG TPA: hypothetical protein PKW66_20225, partial [Polyangiaceae bacterium]|nr:hypothetical protein [Polyangiaceae bacterium]
MPWMLGVLTLVTAVALASCDFKRPPYAVLGHEIGDINCHDGLDNDGDGLIDCEDPDCIYESTWCGEFIPLVEEDYEPEPDLRLVRRYCRMKLPDGADNPYYDIKKCKSAGKAILAVCHDSIDNDFDGQFDCGDKGCSNIQENCCAKEFTNETCSDGIDNDQNGFTDCQDFSCRHGLYVTVCVENTDALCSDGIDNDGDGKTDCKDSNCQGTAYCKGKDPENTDAKCSDGIDNDGDGRIDCVDKDCQALDICKPDGRAEDTLETCSDWIDNDGNGYRDCADNSCRYSKDPAIL